MTYPCAAWSCLNNVLLRERKEYIQPAAGRGVSTGYLATRSVSGASSELSRRKSGEAPWLGRSAHVMIGFYLTLLGAWCKGQFVVNLFTLAIAYPEIKFAAKSGGIIYLVKDDFNRDNIASLVS